MGWLLTPRPGHFTPWIDSVPIVQEAGWPPGLVWTGAENLAPTGIRSPDHPARSESLYRLSHRDSRLSENVKERSSVEKIVINLEYKVHLEQFMNARVGSRDIALLFL
jgi:hypothetical protein